MSSRLKKKLGNLGVDPSSARANESFCLIGTPLPPLEKSKDNGEFVPLWKQDVTNSWPLELADGSPFSRYETKRVADVCMALSPAASLRGISIL
jgi:hypothetical protein